MIEAASRASTRRSTRPGWPCAEAAPPELAPGTLVGSGRFVVGALLGRGGMATVYAGRDRRLGRDVALKVMLGDPSEDPGRARRFELEAELVARLPLHPGLLRWRGAGTLPELGGRPFLATERVDGPTLAFRMAATLCMRPHEVVGLGLGLAEGLVATHGAGIVHRDLTSRNVVLRPTTGDDTPAQPVLVDFGLAAVIDLDPRVARLTRLHQRPGTVTAMAPEQFRGGSPHPAMDVYALGRLLYQMLTGEDPHAMVSRDQLLEHHRDGVRVAPRLAGWCEGAPSSLGVLVDACTEPAPRGRPSAEEVCGELRAIASVLQSGGSPAAPATAFSRSAPVSSEVIVIEAAPRAVAAPSRACLPWTGWRTGWRPGWRTGWRWLGAGLAVLAAVGLARAWSGSEPATEPPGDARPVEPFAVAWPSTVVPLGSIERASTIVPLGGRERRSRPSATTARRASVPAEPLARPAPQCEAQRERAHAAARRWAWLEVLDATADPGCWPEPSARVRLRLVAWIEKQRFDACVDEGADVRDPALVRLVERCRRRRAHADPFDVGGGPQ